MTQKWSLRRAAMGGAIVGAVAIVLNVFLTPELAAAGFLAVALMTLGGALGGAVLFVFVSWVGNLLIR